MKAIVYTRYGPPDVLRLEELEKPVPKQDEVLIKVHAVEVTKADCELRSFRFPVKWFWLPLRLVMGVTAPRRSVLGCYFAGEIESASDNVKGVKAGDAVFGCAGLSMGAYAEYMCLKVGHTFTYKPDNMSYAEAAAVPLGGLNALHFLRKANISRGEKVLINGAGGSIGMFGLQIAKAMGAEVTAVDKGLKSELLLQLGADYFIDYQKEDFAKHNQYYDVILDVVAQSSYSACIASLKSNGRYIMANPNLLKMLRSVLTSKLTDKKVIFAFAGEKEEELIALREMVEAGKIKSVIDKIFPFEHAPEAHRQVETEQRVGAIIMSAFCE